MYGLMARDLQRVRARRNRGTASGAGNVAAPHLDASRPQWWRLPVPSSRAAIWWRPLSDGRGYLGAVAVARWPGGGWPFREEERAGDADWVVGRSLLEWALRSGWVAPPAAGAGWREMRMHQWAWGPLVEESDWWVVIRAGVEPAAVVAGWAGDAAPEAEDAVPTALRDAVDSVLRAEASSRQIAPLPRPVGVPESDDPEAWAAWLRGLAADPAPWDEAASDALALAVHAGMLAWGAPPPSVEAAWEAAAEQADLRAWIGVWESWRISARELGLGPDTPPDIEPPWTLF
ncbi:protein of unknown function [Candidatus Hydrogenisulfobacillus filiaventi]|uniref:Uncharacterized protein n=1 Tax=Candidatus Hydrogenisulfobacillus filiaventi TaxID=2707344 RepID=A0A6F8ZHZ8_9FIRM|nr:protein of unknown function [Candidatus Hydrogenisulfobacillus filiaventi]